MPQTFSYARIHDRPDVQYTAIVSPLQQQVDDLIRQQLEWQEATIKGLLKPWQVWLITHIRSPRLARLFGIERRQSHNWPEGETTIEIWQRGACKARGTFKFGTK